MFFSSRSTCITSIGSLLRVNACREGSLEYEECRKRGKKVNNETSELLVDCGQSFTCTQERTLYLLHAQERIAEQFLANGARDRDLDVLVQQPPQFLSHMGIVRFDVDRELEVGPGVFVTTVDLGLDWQRCQDMEQAVVHVCCRALKEPTATAQEKRITCENGSVGSILCIVADTTLRVTVRPQCLDRDVANLELFFVLDHVVDLGDSCVCSKDGQAWLLGNQFHVATGMVPVVVCAENRGEFGSKVLEDMHNLLRLDWVYNGSLGRGLVENDVCIIV